MNETKKYLAIIPARGGSKRLPRKNVLPLAGKPLIAWTIEAALQCSKIDKVVVTSDDDEILAIAASYSVDCIKRPAILATDTSTSFDVIKHSLEEYLVYEYCMLLQPTSPLRTHDHIQEALDQLEARSADAVISVCKTEHSPLWANTLPNNKSMQSFLCKESLNKRSQELPSYYRLNGALYICRTKKLLEQGTFFLKDNVYAYIMSERSSVDIDTELDFKWTEFLMKQHLNECI